MLEVAFTQEVPSSYIVSHVYSQVAFAYNVTFSASDSHLQYGDSSKLVQKAVSNITEIIYVGSTLNIQKML